MKWVGHVACMKEVGELCTNLWLESLKGRGHMEDLGIHGMILGKCVFLHFILSLELKCFNLENMQLPATEEWCKCNGKDV